MHSFSADCDTFSNEWLLRMVDNYGSNEMSGNGLFLQMLLIMGNTKMLMMMKQFVLILLMHHIYFIHIKFAEQCDFFMCCW